MKTILVPVDFSPATFKTCAAAAAFAKLSHARLTFVHVIRPLPLYPDEIYADEKIFLTEILQPEKDYAARKLRELVKRWRSPAVSVGTRLQRGNPVGEIIASAKATKASYIVIGSHGHGAMYDLFVGSTTHGVMRRANCPVMVVPVAPRKKSS